jgi:hypothetical protein
MRIATLIFLHTFATLAHLTESVANDISNTQDLADELIDKFADKLVDLMISKAAGPSAMLKKPGFSPSSAFPLAPAGNRPQFRVNAMRGSYMQPAAAPLASYRPQIQQSQGGAVSVQAMQDTLKSYGVASSPMQKLALTALAGTRDVSMAAQTKQVFASMNSKTQAAVIKAEGAVQAKAKDMAGVVPPLGFWDPWGFTTDCDEGQLLFYREVELMHGRISMLASLGVVMGEHYGPIFGGKPDVPAVFAAESTSNILFWPAVFIATATLELGKVQVFGSSDRFSEEATKEGWTIDSGRVPGDFGFDPLGMKPKTPNDLLQMQNKELLNGRLAMIAAAGMIAQELVTGQKIFS